MVKTCPISKANAERDGRNLQRRRRQQQRKQKTRKTMTQTVKIAQIKEE